MEDGPGIVEDLLIAAWMILSVAVCVFAGYGFSSWLLKEPRSSERLIRYRRQLLDLTSKYHSDLHQDLAGVELDAQDPRYTRSNDQRVRDAADQLKREESYRSRRQLIAAIAAVLIWFLLSGIAIELGYNYYD